MGFTLIDFVKGFHFMKARRRFSAGTQSCYFAILTEFQLAGLPSELPLSTRELKELAGLKSVSATHEARNILKNSKLVDFKTVGGVTVYTLGTEHLPNSNRTLTEHPTEHLTERQGLVCYTPAQVQSGDDGATLPLPPAPPNPNPKALPKQSNQAGMAEQAEQRDIVDVWEEMTRTKLTSPADQFALRHYDDTHGREIVKVAIREHVYSNGRTFKYFKACLDSLLARLRGGEEDGRLRMDRRAGGGFGGVQGFAQRESGGDGELPDETDYEGLAAAIAAVQKPKSSD